MEKLSETLNINPVTTIDEKPNLPAPVEPTVADSMEDEDFLLARAKLKTVLDLGEEALHGILELADDSEEARSYEVVGQIMKSVTDTTKELYELHLKRKKFNEVVGRPSSDNFGSGGNGNINVDKAIFVGTTADLLNKINGMKSDE